MDTVRHQAVRPDLDTVVRSVLLASFEVASIIRWVLGNRLAVVLPLDDTMGVAGEGNPDETGHR